MQKREAKFTVLFRHWILSDRKSYDHFNSAAFELKQTQTKSMPFSDVKEHQVDALLAVAHGQKGLLWKLPDDSRNIKPFDLFFLHKSHAFVVIRYPKFFCLISIDRFIKERDSSKRKSLTSDRAQAIANILVNVKKPYPKTKK